MCDILTQSSEQPLLVESSNKLFNNVMQPIDIEVHNFSDLEDSSGNGNGSNSSSNSDGSNSDGSNSDGSDGSNSNSDEQDEDIEELFQYNCDISNRNENPNRDLFPDHHRVSFSEDVTICETYEIYSSYFSEYDRRGLKIKKNLTDVESKVIESEISDLRKELFPNGNFFSNTNIGGEFSGEKIILKPRASSCGLIDFSPISKRK
eukprot:Pgem_evm1s19727